MSAKTYSLLVAILFTLITGLQVARALMHIDAMVGGRSIPEMASWIAAGVIGSLALLGFAAARR
jgi:hypothetical protein